MDAMCTNRHLGDVFHGAATLYQRIRTGKMVAPLWFYLHPGDQVDLTNTLFPLDTYCTAKHGLYRGVL